jgi:hypothetical protein
LLVAVGRCAGCVGRLGGASLLGPHASGLVGVIPIVADGVLALVGDVLEDGGEEVERLEDLEVPLDAREEFRAVRVWESGVNTCDIQ